MKSSPLRVENQSAKLRVSSAIALMQSLPPSPDMPVLYFDHNATTPIAPEVSETMLAAFHGVYGNASSVHSAGQAARKCLEDSRRKIADSLNASPAQLLLTGGGTESNNLALLGLVRGLSDNAQRSPKHVITSTIEHPAVLQACRQLEREGIEFTYLNVDCDGAVSVDDVDRNLRPSTVLVSIMHANNEVGAIQPIEEIGALIRQRRAAGQAIYFHSDGVQAFGKIDVDVKQLGVDLYSISAHKLYGPKGIGGLFVRRGTPLAPIQYGGRHERGFRPGTENVPASMGFARAIELFSPNDSTHVSILRDRFESEIRSFAPEIKINGRQKNRLPNTSNLLFFNISAEALVIALDMQGIAVSTGSACSSGSIEPSHVLLAMGRTRDEARSSVRFSFGRYNTQHDVTRLIDAVVKSVSRLRTVALREAHVGV